MNIHYLQHVPFEGPGNIMDWVRRGRHTLGATRFYCGAPLPPVETLNLLVVMGGPMNVYEEARYPWLADEKRFIEQAIAAGRLPWGTARRRRAGCEGVRQCRQENRLVSGRSDAGRVRRRAVCRIPPADRCFHWHGDTFDISAGAVHVARSAGCANQAFVYDERIVGLQFHLETTPANAQQIITYCADEIVEDRFIQSPQVMLANPHRFKAINYASGMCDAGRIKHHLRHNLGRPECSVLITGFHANGTLGRRLVDGDKEVRIFGEDIAVRASIHTLGGFSAHADQHALLAWTAGFDKPPVRTFVVHGEAVAVNSFAQQLRTQNNWTTVEVPEIGQSYYL